MANIDEVVKKLFKVLCGFVELPLEVRDFLFRRMDGRFYGDREILFEKNDLVREVFFVSSGYVVCYGFNRYNDRHLLSIYGEGSIIIGKSLVDKGRSGFELVALPGTYLLRINLNCIQEMLSRYPMAHGLARRIIADVDHKNLMRLVSLRGDAASLVLDFYKNFPECKRNPNLLSDSDIASFLLIGESTLRNNRVKLVREGKLRIRGQS